MDKFNGKVLVVDDDENITEVIKMYLESSGYGVRTALDGKKAKEFYSEYNPDIVLLDVMIPYIDGVEVLKWIRKQSDTPVIMLTAKGDTYDKVLALEIGADDYIVKPFEPKELVARVKAVLRRYNKEQTKEDIIYLDNLTIDSTSYKVIYKGKNLKMPPKEFELLYFLSSNKNKVFTREQLLCEVWGYDYPGDSRTVDVHIKRLREKIGDDNTWQLQTVWGVGYKFEIKKQE
ncbi:response regulator transcription factor [Clostridium sp. BJN0001]|uniref:response regulator transcription factor n=1 Tax=Clostridium sp. BJN0001 TaxID=2930219 RepID=UPI001FD01D1A|nr:response regulator transcription factor [Clostridium sp. BJN0001]